MAEYVIFKNPKEEGYNPEFLTAGEVSKRLPKAEKDLAEADLALTAACVRSYYAGDAPSPEMKSAWASYIAALTAAENLKFIEFCQWNLKEFGDVGFKDLEAESAIGEIHERINGVPGLLSGLFKDLMVACLVRFAPKAEKDRYAEDPADEPEYVRYHLTAAVAEIEDQATEAIKGLVRDRFLAANYQNREKPGDGDEA